jgi:kinesin family protein 11
MNTQLHSLDEIVSRVRAQNNSHHAAHTSSLGSLATNVQSSYSSIGEHLSTSFDRVKELQTDIESQTSTLQSTLPCLASDAAIRAPLRDLRAGISEQALLEYVPTGETPQRMQYAYPSTLPRTEPHDSLLARLRGRPDATLDSNRSPTKGLIFNDPSSSPIESLFTAYSGIRPTSATSSGTAPSLRELDVNVVAGDSVSAPPTMSLTLPSDLDKVAMPPLKRQNTNVGASESGMSKLPTKSMSKKGARVTVAGVGMGPGAGDRENLPVVNFSASVGPGRRRLRSHES